MLGGLDHQRLLRALESAEIGTFDASQGPDAVPAVTEGLKRLFGFGPDDHPSVAEYLARVHDDDRAAVAAAVDQSFATRQGHWVELRVLRPDGTQAWLAARTQVVEEPDGSGTRLLGAVADISARKTAEARLQDSHALLRLATEASGAGWNTWDLSTGATVWDRRGQEIMGFLDDPEAAATIDGWRRRVHPDDLPGLEEQIERCLAEGDDFSAEYRVVRPDGSVRIVHSVGRFGGADGSRSNGSGLTFDVTELTEARAALVASERFQRRVLDSLVAFAGVMAPDGTMLEIDVSALTISGLSREDVVGRKFWDCYWWTYSPDVVARIREDVVRAAAGEVVRHDTVARILDDGRLAIDLQIAPLRDDDGVITHLIPSALDITERKRAEDELRRREAAERRDRLRAELITEVLSELERGNGLDERARRLVDLLVPRVVAQAVVSVDGRVLADAGAAPAPGEQQPMISVDLDLGGGVEGCLEVSVDPPTVGHLAGDVVADPVALVREIAERAAVLLASARIREEEHRVALRLQRALLPDALVRHPRVDVAALYAAADAALEVGGDWYDSWLDDEGRVGLTVGDVVGHGLESAAAMGRLRSAITALAGEGAGPGSLLERLDRFAGTGTAVPFATAVCAVLDPVTGHLRHASAGHPPGLVVAPDGTVTWLDGGRSGPLTAPRRAGRPEGETTLSPGSLLVLYSDGLVERRGETISEGLHRLRAAASVVAGASASTACRDLLTALTTGASLRDDVVVLAARLRD